ANQVGIGENAVADEAKHEGQETLNPGKPARRLPYIGFTGALLLGQMRRVVGGNDVDSPVAQRFPGGLQIGGGTKRWQYFGEGSLTQEFVIVGKLVMRRHSRRKGPGTERTEHGDARCAAHLEDMSVDTH